MKQTLLLIALASALTLSHAETLVWNANPPEEEVVFYTVYQTTNGVAIPAIKITNGTQYPFTALSGVAYRFSVTATSSNLIESLPSEAVVYLKTSPIPAINVTGRTIGGYDKTAKEWLNLRINWGSIGNLSQYGVTNVWLNVTPNIGLPYSVNAGAGTSYTFAKIAAQDYTFSVSATNSLGGSPAGTSLFLSARPPQNPKGGIVQS